MSINNPQSFTVQLHNLKFHSFHGLYPEEKLLGGEYEVSVDVCFEAEGKIISIHQTVNYVAVYHTIRRRMDQPTELLETLAQELCDEIHAMDDRIHSIDINIKKLYPPIESFVGNVGVSYSAKY